MPESFPLALWFTVKFSEIGFKTLVSSGEGGRERRRSKVSAARLEFSFPLNSLTASELTTLYDFYAARKGALESFNVTVDGTVYLVRFAKDGLSWEWFHQNWKKSSVTLRQVPA
jgi:hypothetical protein